MIYAKQGERIGRRYLEPNDLRIGNYVLYGEKICEVTTRNIYMDGTVQSFCTKFDVVVTAKATESGTEIIIK